MAQAIVDPEELREFARVLKKFNNELRDRASTLGDRLSALNATWRDQEHRKFADAFDEHMAHAEALRRGFGSIRTVLAAQGRSHRKLFAIVSV